ncbi:MAG: hypothetical protein ABSH41_14570 [Syntrophobacteraceae bacterium]|jgi:hypothetical protein
MSATRCDDKLIQYEDAFMYHCDQPASPENVEKMVTFSVLYSEALMDEEQASYIHLGKRVDQLKKNAKILLECRMKLRFEYHLGGPIIDAIDKTRASIKDFAQLHSTDL